ncbi:MAG TPA: MoaD/ThiS family protein [Terracidiphilus sp.]|nr:MoaD/ThiS family protein [Terracidiphilus sp.]
MAESVRNVRVQIPYHLRNLARVDGDITLEVTSPVTIRSVLDAIEARYPMLMGTIRDHDTLKRRPFLRFFACEEDLTHDPPDKPLPDAVAEGREPLLIIGAIAGGAMDDSTSLGTKAQRLRGALLHD